jgi:AcrR family transcriptional regulator
MVTTTAAVPTRKKRPDSRRQELLEAATELILTQGVTDLRVEDVTNAAGAAKGTFYRYFASKDHLIAALRDSYIEDYLAQLDRRVAGVQGWEPKVEAIIAATVDFYVANLQLHDVLFMLSDHGPIEVDEGPGASDVSVVGWLVEFISDGVAAGAFQVRDPWFAASLLYSALHGVLDREIQVNGTIDRTSTVAATTEVFLRVLAAAPGGGRRLRLRR